MRRSPSTVKKVNLTRVMKAVQATGRDIACVEVSPDGLIVIVLVRTDARSQVDSALHNGNAVVADDLDRELAKFNAHHDND